MIADAVIRVHLHQLFHQGIGQGIFFPDHVFFNFLECSFGVGDHMGGLSKAGGSPIQAAVNTSFNGVMLVDFWVQM